MAPVKPTRHNFADLAAASSALADLVVEVARAEVAAKGYCTLVLAGGSTPRHLYELLATSPRREQLPWQQIFVFFGDERCVPADDEHSNFRMAREQLLNRVELPAGNILPMACDASDPAGSASRHEAEIGAFFAAHGRNLSPGRDWPEFDLILLGMGEDGHTASLFPSDPALAERQRWVAAVVLSPSKPRLPRLTLTLPVLNHARRVAFLVAGPSKRQLLAEFDRQPQAAQRYPAAMVQPLGELYWFVAG